jgi:hypothetical protein
MRVGNVHRTACETYTDFVCLPHRLLSLECRAWGAAQCARDDDDESVYEVLAVFSCAGRAGWDWIRHAVCADDITRRNLLQPEQDGCAVHCGLWIWDRRIGLSDDRAATTTPDRFPVDGA